MKRSPQQCRQDALAIWQAGVDAVRSDRLIRDNLRVAGQTLCIGDESIDLNQVGRIAVVGAGKAGAGMAAGLEETLGDDLMDAKQLTGWINVPADCARKLKRIQLHAARPAGVNEPTAEGVAGAERILQMVASLDPDDLCLCMLSGGGSALLPAPVEGITLADKQAVTRWLSGAGANIEQLNTVRKQLSRIKGGRLAELCRARMFTVIVSDVIGDPLDVIASGPTVPSSTTARDALDVLDHFEARQHESLQSVIRYLENAAREFKPASDDFSRVTHLVIGNNAIAVDAAGVEAERRGYSHAMHAATNLEGAAEDVGRHLATMALQMRDQPGPDCLITGGEPTVTLASESERGRGGRNQQLVLAALEYLAENDAEAGRGIAILSGGTDGEDGPTDAAGAWIDGDVLADARLSTMNPADYLRRNDAYSFFQQLDSLIRTGPTHTNVCDLRVVVVDRVAS